MSEGEVEPVLVLAQGNMVIHVKLVTFNKSQTFVRAHTHTQKKAAL